MNVSVLAYEPAFSASLAPIACWNCTGTAALVTGAAQEASGSGVAVMSANGVALLA